MTPGHAKQEVFEFIEGFHNPRRRHSAIGYESPVSFEQNMRLHPGMRRRRAVPAARIAREQGFGVSAGFAVASAGNGSSGAGRRTGDEVLGESLSHVTGIFPESLPCGLALY